MKMFRILFAGSTLLILLLTPRPADAQENPDSKRWVEAGGGVVLKSRNDVQIPANSGTRFSLSDGAAGPFPAYRAYAGFRFLKNHEILGLWAPLSVEGGKKFDQNISYQGTTFSNTQGTDFLYKFNSYRLSYRYQFFISDK